MATEISQATLRPYFAEGFLDDHAGRMITDPCIAIVELVANCWDAGSKRVDIIWPEGINGIFQIADDGSGMTQGEFTAIWRELNYDRKSKQGSNVVFPELNSHAKRTAYGRNGKGRHSLFCFADEYNVETWKNGVLSSFHVKRTHGEAPYNIVFIEERTKMGHGTKLSCELIKNPVKVEDIRDLLGSKFIIDPLFSIYLNGRKIDLLDLKDVHAEEYEIPGEGIVKILRLDSKKSGRTSKQHGVAWWVNNRLVGQHSWEGFEGTYLDGRSSEAKRFTFIVVADFLIEEVKPDWTSFRDTPKAKKVREEINKYIIESINKLMQESRSSTKIEVLAQHKSELKLLSNTSKYQIGRFIDEIQIKCPTMTQDNLSDTVGVITKMEMSRTGYKLLQQLAQLSSGDLDTLSSILDEWSIVEAREILSELQWRLVLCNKSFKF